MSATLVITSLTNDRVKAIRALEMRKVRKETGLFVAEGVSILVTARDNGFRPETLIMQTGTAASGIQRGLLTWAHNERAEVLEVSEAVLAKLASKDNPQTMLGVFRQKFVPAPAPPAVSENATWIVLEEVRDPGNLGTIIRTAEAAGAAGVILVGNCCDPFAPETIRATMGSVFAVPLVKMERENFADFAKSWPGDVIATHLSARDDFRSVSFRAPELIVMGSEGPGLSDAALAVCTRRVKIPMSGQLDSLNLAIATALTLYQVRGQRLKV